MLVAFDGNFHPTATFCAFYITFLIMVVFNIVLNKSRDFLTIEYWIGKTIYSMVYASHILYLIQSDIVLNSYFSVLHYNYVDYQALVDKKKKEKQTPHEPTMVRQIIYFLMVLFIYLG